MSPLRQKPIPCAYCQSPTRSHSICYDPTPSPVFFICNDLMSAPQTHQADLCPRTLALAVLPARAAPLHVPWLASLGHPDVRKTSPNIQVAIQSPSIISSYLTSCRALISALYFTPHAFVDQLSALEWRPWEDKRLPALLTCFLSHLLWVHIRSLKYICGMNK